MDIKVSKHKRIDWENLIYVKWNRIKNMHKDEDNQQRKKK